MHAAVKLAHSAGQIHIAGNRLVFRAVPHKDHVFIRAALGGQMPHQRPRRRAHIVRCGQQGRANPAKQVLVLGGFFNCGAHITMGLPLLLGVGSWFNAAFPVLRHYDITVRTQGLVPSTYVDKPLKLGVITDIHLGRLLTAGRLGRAIELLAPEQPDAILYVGDIIDDHIKLDAEATAAALAVAQPRLGHWAVPGNHEYISGSIDKSLDFLRAVGMGCYLLLGAAALTRVWFLG